MRKLYLVLSLFFSCLAFAVGQKSITGNIVDQNSEPLIGVNIFVKGNESRGTLSDIDGGYTISAKEGETLIFSYIGFKTQEALIGTSNTIDVSMSPDALVLEDIVVIGYGQSKKSDLTGAVSSVSGEQLRTNLTTNIDQALQGRVAGVQVTQNSGAPGGAASIRIRGANSINGSNEPLYVVDGLPFTGNGASTIGFDWAGGANGQNRVNPLSTISPNDILSIDVLKDASATAIYGTRGANGVIIITTKRGKKGESKISYNTYYGLQTLRKKLDMMDMAQYADYNNQITRDLEITPDQRYADPSLLGRGTNWQNEIFTDAGSHSHQLSVVGGTDRTSYAITGGYFKQDGTVIGSDFDRISTRVNLDNKVKDWFKVGASLAFSKTSEKITLNDGGDGVIIQSLLTLPSVSVRDIDGNYDGPESQFGTNYNPVAAALQRNNTLSRQRLMANLFGDFTIGKGLVFRSELNFDNNHSVGKAFQPTYKWGVLENTENRLRQNEDNSFFWVIKNYLTYEKKLTEKHSITAMLGQEAQKSNYFGNSITVANLPSNDIQELVQGGTVIGNPGSYKGAQSLASYYGRFNYNFNELVLATFTYRGDASSKFGPGNKWGYFPSGSVAVRLSQMEFLKNSSLVTNMKLRLGYGLSGSDNIGNNLFEPLMRPFQTPFGNAYVPGNIANPDLGWETTAQANLGLDLTVFKDRLDVSIDVYNKNTRDLLLQSNPPGYLSGIAPPFINIGKVNNKGIDFSLNSRNINRNKFSWNSDLTLSVNRNKIVELESDGKVYYRNLYWYSEFQTVTATTVGMPIGMFYGYQMEGIFKDQQDILNHAVQISDKVITETRPNGTNLVSKNQGVWIGDVKFKDLNGDGVIDTDDQTFIGNPNPDFTFGLNNSFNYGAFEFGVYLTGSYGADILNHTRSVLEGQTGIFINQASTVFGRAQFKYLDPNGSTTDPANVVLANPGTNIPRPTTNDNNRNNRMSDRFIENGSYLRLQTLRLGYTLPSSLTKRVKMERLKVYANVSNLAVWSNYSGYDPEIGAFNQSSLVQNVDMGRYPTPRMFTLGLDVDF